MKPVNYQREGMDQPGHLPHQVHLTPSSTHTLPVQHNQHPINPFKFHSQHISSSPKGNTFRQNRGIFFIKSLKSESKEERETGNKDQRGKFQIAPGQEKQYFRRFIPSDDDVQKRASLQFQQAEDLGKEINRTFFETTALTLYSREFTVENPRIDLKWKGKEGLNQLGLYFRGQGHKQSWTGYLLENQTVVEMVSPLILKIARVFEGSQANHSAAGKFATIYIYWNSEQQMQDFRGKLNQARNNVQQWTRTFLQKRKRLTEVKNRQITDSTPLINIPQWDKDQTGNILKRFPLPPAFTNPSKTPQKETFIEEPLNLILVPSMTPLKKGLLEGYKSVQKSPTVTVLEMLSSKRRSSLNQSFQRTCKTEQMKPKRSKKGGKGQHQGIDWEKLAKPSQHNMITTKEPFPADMKRQAQETKEQISQSPQPSPVQNPEPSNWDRSNNEQQQIIQVTAFQNKQKYEDQDEKYQREKRQREEEEYLRTTQRGYQPSGGHQSSKIEDCNEVDEEENDETVERSDPENTLDAGRLEEEQEDDEPNQAYWPPKELTQKRNQEEQEYSFPVFDRADMSKNVYGVIEEEQEVDETGERKSRILKGDESSEHNQESVDPSSHI